MSSLPTVQQKPLVRFYDYLLVAVKSLRNEMREVIICQRQEESNHGC